MSVKIITKHETGGTGDEPLSTDLEKGELGVNTVDGKLWVGDGASKKLLTPSGGLIDGLADGNTLRWEDSTSEWEATSNLVVSDAGNVGIGTTPNTWGSVFTAVDLDTTGAIAAAGTFKATYVTSNMYFDGSVWRYKIDGAASHIAVGADNIAFINAASGVAGGVATNVETMRIDSSGRVGIGTDDPSSPLTVFSPTTNTECISASGTADPFNTRRWILSANSSGGFDGALWDTNIATSVGVHTWSINGTERMRIDGSGAVGIGTDNPERKLSVVGGTTAFEQMRVAPEGGTLGQSSGIEFGYTFSQGWGGADYEVRHSGGISYEPDNSSPEPRAASMRFYTTGVGADNKVERMRIDYSGNVKISTGNLELSNGGGWFQSDANWVRSLNGLAVYNSNTTANAFTTPGDFTAGYSDMRLKTHLGTIPDALDKVCSLEGFYYERNDKAVELGYTGGERRVGLSAQDVQAVLPEVVKDAPINIDNGTDYLTVDYERVVPLLVEAIKAQQIQIDELKRNQK